MLKEEIAEIFDLFDYYNIPEDSQRGIFSRGVNFDFTYGDPDYNHINENLDVFGVGMLLKYCKENNINIDISEIIYTPILFKNKSLVKDVADAQRYKYYGKIKKLGTK
jgi:hypothetical protein